MDKLLQPDTGLIVWTIATFLLLVLVLGKAAWKPILEAINQREGKIREDLERAERSQKDAEALRLKYESQLSQAQRSIQEMVNQARKDGEKLRADLLSAAKEESGRLLEKGRKDLSGEADKLKAELRSEVADLSVQIAQKILGRSIDKKVQDEVFKDSLYSISEVKK